MRYAAVLAAGLTLGLGAAAGAAGTSVLFVGNSFTFGDGSVRCVPTYGHTAGHQSLVVRTDNAEYVFCGDTCYFKETLENNALPGFGYDLAAQARTLDWLREMQDAGAKLVFGHDPNQWPTLGPELA